MERVITKGPEIKAPEGELFTFQSNETDPQVVRAEVDVLIKEAKKRRRARQAGKEDGWGMDVFNNFFLNFDSQENFIGNIRQMIRTYFPEDAWTKKFKEFAFGKDGGHSELYENNSPEKFFAEVDAAAEICEVDPERDIWEARKLRGTDAVYANPKVQEAYVILRTKGYNHYKDLTA